MKEIQTVISRAEGADTVRRLSRRGTAALLAECEAELCQHLRDSRLRHVRRVVDVSHEESLLLPHFTVAVGDVPADVYVLSVAGPASAAALTAEQCRYCEQRKGRATYVLPCVVQHLKEDVARCVALPPVELRRADAWHQEPETLQYIPLSYSRAAGVPMPCSAWLLKKRTLLREVANHGTQLYPMVRRFAHAGHMPEGMEIRGSGTESPLVLTITAGRKDGRLQLHYGDFYSADNAVNELVVVAQPEEDEPPLASLKSDDGSVYHALCAEMQMFPEHDWLGLRFVWSLSLLCHHMSRITAADAVTGFDGSRMCVEVSSSRRSELCGLPLCHLVGKNGNQVVNIYAVVYDEDAILPQAGDWVSAEGVLYAVPDERVVEVSIPAPQPIAPARPAPVVDKGLLPLSPVLAVVAGGLQQAGYTWDAPFKPIFRNGLPELRLRAPGGEPLLVLVDTAVNGVRDRNGYARFEPSSYPSRLGAVPPDNQPADVLFATVELAVQVDGSYSTAVKLHGAVPEGVSFCSSVMPAPAKELPEAEAALAFGKMMVTHEFAPMLPLMREDMFYESDTAGLRFYSRWDFLRHMRACFDNWRKRGELPNLSFLLSNLEWEGRLRPCIVACQNGEVISATVCDVKAGRIVAMHSLSGGVLDTLRPPENDQLS
ncbi:MAG: hypothetical protein II295_09755 [Akkermansia sp.]|nr:hypothetical protein [Akkermansia sp.]